MNLQIYTDGACSGNPVGNGSWASIFVLDDRIAYVLYGELYEATANKSELQAVYSALEHLKEQGMIYETIDIFCDSAYVVNCVNKNHLKKWVKRGWRNQDNMPIKHRELWEPIHSLMLKHDIKFHKIRGHSGDVLNSMADQLAKLQLKKMNDPKFYQEKLKLVKTIEADI